MPGDTRVDRHPVVAQRRRQCQREPEQPVLGRREVHPLGVACQCVAAEDVDDPPAGDERGQRAPDAAEGAVEGDRADLMPVVLGDRLDALPRTVRGVVDQDSQRAARRRRSSNMRRTADGSVTLAVTAKALPPPARIAAATASASSVRARVFTATVSPSARKTFGDDRTQTAARAGDQGDVSHWHG